MSHSSHLCKTQATLNCSMQRQDINWKAYHDNKNTKKVKCFFFKKKERKKKKVVYLSDLKILKDYIRLLLYLMREESICYPVDEVFHFGLQTPPFELDSDQFVCTHVRTICLQLTLQRAHRKSINKDRIRIKKQRTKMSKILCPCLVPSIQGLKVLCLFWLSEKAQGLLLAYSPAGESKEKKSLNVAEHQLVCCRSTEKARFFEDCRYYTD